MYHWWIIDVIMLWICRRFLFIRVVIKCSVKNVRRALIISKRTMHACWTKSSWVDSILFRLACWKKGVTSSGNKNSWMGIKLGVILTICHAHSVRDLVTNKKVNHSTNVWTVTHNFAKNATKWSMERESLCPTKLIKYKCLYHALINATFLCAKLTINLVYTCLGTKYCVRDVSSNRVGDIPTKKYRN